MIDPQKIEKLKQLQSEVKSEMHEAVTTLLAQMSSLSPELRTELVATMLEDDSFFSSLQSLLSIDSPYNDMLEGREYTLTLGKNQLWSNGT